MKTTIFNSVAGGLGAFVTYAFGGWTELMSFFLLAVMIDIVTGLLASVKEGSGISSAVGFDGLAKKVFMLIAIMLAHRVDVLMGTSFIMDGAIYCYLANELVSITENYGRMGLPLPDALKRVISVLKDRGSKDGGDAQ
jgi:toxin secretion/phage lysis holin